LKSLKQFTVSNKYAISTLLMYYPTQKGCNLLIDLPFLSLRVTIFADIRCRKFVSFTTFCNLDKNLEPQYWPDSCRPINIGG
jgi:hypothetical protein